MTFRNGTAGLWLTAINSSWTKNLDSPEVVAAALSALVAVTAAVLAFRSSSLQRTIALQDRELQFREAQMGQLYGPLTMLRATSSNFRKLLPPGPPIGVWRTVDNIEWLQDGSHEIEKTAVTEILKLGKQVEDLITEKAGLFENSKARTSAAEFVAHSAQLRMYWNEGKNEPAQGRLPFPSGLDEYLAADVAVINARLTDLRNRRRRQIQTTLVLRLLVAVGVGVLIGYLVGIY